MKNSRFTGSAWGLFGWSLLIVLATYLFLVPLAFVLPKYLKWYYSHIEIDGEQLEFDYEGPWFGVLGWMLFIVVTFGIGSFYAAKRMMQFSVEHTHVKGDKSKVSSFDGSAWGLFGWYFALVLSVYAFIIPLAFVIVPVAKWSNEHTVISGRQLKFEHDGPWFGVLGWMLFTFVTLGFGAYYAQKKEIQWAVEHTHFA